jgi:hypothetical protein
MSNDPDFEWRARLELLRTLAGVLALIALTLVFKRLEG